MVKIGLIGCGFMGGTHLSAYEQLQASGKFKVTAIADLDVKRAEKYAAKLGAKIYANGEELLEKADVNTVDICLPTYLHFQFAYKAIEKGYNVFIEKPLCLHAKDADKLADFAEKKGIIAMVGQCIRFWDEYVYLKEIYDSKTYGNVVNASFKRLSPRPTWGWNNWLLDANLSGGAAQDLHIHDSDYMLHLFGEPKNINTIKNTKGEKNSYIMTICNYSDFAVSIEGTWDLPSSFPFEMAYRVVFEKAVIDFSSIKGIKIYTNDGKVIIPEIKKACRSSNESGGNISDLGGYYNELSYFVDCLYNNKKVERATLKDGAKAVNFIKKELGEK